MRAFCRKLGLNVQYFGEDGENILNSSLSQCFQEFCSILIAYHSGIGQFIALFIEEQDTGRTEQAITLKQGLVGAAVGCDVGLQQ